MPFDYHNERTQEEQPASILPVPPEEMEVFWDDMKEGPQEEVSYEPVDETLPLTFREILTELSDDTRQDIYEELLERYIAYVDNGDTAMAKSITEVLVLLTGDKPEE